jgi:hypothetical protein
MHPRAARQQRPAVRDRGRVVLRHPRQHGVREPREAEAAGAPERRLEAPLAVPAVDDGGGACVQPQRRVAGGPPVGVDEPAPVALGGGRHHIDRLAVNRRGCFAHAGGDCAPDRLHVLLGAVGGRMQHLRAPASDRQLAALGVEGDALDQGRSGVEREECHVAQPRRAASSRSVMFCFIVIILYQCL